MLSVVDRPRRSCRTTRWPCRNCRRPRAQRFSALVRPRTTVCCWWSGRAAFTSTVRARARVVELLNALPPRRLGPCRGRHSQAASCTRILRLPCPPGCSPRLRSYVRARGARARRGTAATARTILGDAAGGSRAPADLLRAKVVVPGGDLPADARRGDRCEHAAGAVEGPRMSGDLRAARVERESARARRARRERCTYSGRQHGARGPSSTRTHVQNRVGASPYSSLCHLERAVESPAAEAQAVLDARC